MILKVERYNEKQQWWMFDNIAKISVSSDIRKQQKDLEATEHDAVIFDMPRTECVCYDGETCCGTCSYYKVLICRLNNGEEYSIAFDTIAYLLNDNGKTIEKIVVNYND